MVLYHIQWYCMVFNGSTCHCVLFNGIVMVLNVFSYSWYQCHVLNYQIAKYCTMFNGITWGCMVLNGIARHCALLNCIFCY